MGKYKSMLLITAFLLTACTQDKVVPKEIEKSEENMIVTPDGKLTIEIINNVKVPQEKVESIKNELLTAYDDIQNSIHTPYVPSEKITVYLNEGTQASSGFASEIVLFEVKEETYPLVHEMTHSLLGYGNNFDTSSGYFTQEGFASYMENTYGRNKIDFHKYIKYYLDSNKLIPISKLIDLNQDNAYFRPSNYNKSIESNILMNMSYNHAASFVSYLIDTYGLDKFEQIYNEKDLAKKIEEVYGRNLNELEKDWIDFINSQTEFTTEEKLILNLYNTMKIIDTLDPKLFVQA